MTREEVKKILPIIQAYAEGKTVQMRLGNGWADLVESDFGLNSNQYRIKPEPMEITLVSQSDGTLWVDSAGRCALHTHMCGSKPLKFRQVME